MNEKISYTIHIGDARLLITSSAPGEPYICTTADDILPISRAKVLKKVETYKYIAIFTATPTAFIEELKGVFRFVKAAGGAVENKQDELLMIRLRDRWDLPKGHIEDGETSREAALREVKEETGISAELIGSKPIHTTWHAYNTYGEWELKATDWWQMRALDRCATPQREEGITESIWVTRDELDERLSESYDTIKEVVAALDTKV